MLASRVARGQKTDAVRALTLTVLAAASTLTLAAPASADEPVRPDAADPGAHPPRGTGTTLVLAGLGTTAFWYGGAVGFSYLWPDAPGADDLRVPVAGPWMALADTGCAKTDPDCSLFTVVIRAILTTVDAVGQTGGVLVAGEGVFLTTRDRRTPPTPRRRVGVTPVPFTSGDALGIGVVGAF